MELPFITGVVLTQQLVWLGHVARVEESRNIKIKIMIIHQLI